MPSTLTNVSDQSLAISFNTAWRETTAREFAADYPHGLHLVPGDSIEISDALAADLEQTALVGLEVSE